MRRGEEPVHGSIYEARKLKFPCFRSSPIILTYCLGMDFLSEVHFTMYKDEFILSI